MEQQQSHKLHHKSKEKKKKDKSSGYPLYAPAFYVKVLKVA